MYGVALLNQVLMRLGLAKRPDKTFIGKIERGFDCLGYTFSPESLTVASKTVEQFVEQGAHGGAMAIQQGLRAGEARKVY